MDNQPLVSICIPAHNSGDYLGEALESILGQTYSNLEIIAVDDGSNDRTLQILKQVKDKRLRFFSQSKKGAAAARNEAFRNSRGDFIKFMDSDDLLNIEAISVQINKIGKIPGAIASSSWYRFYDNKIENLKIMPESVWRDMSGIDWVVESLLPTGGNMMQSGIFLIPRNIVEMVGPWNESLSLIDDFEYMVRILCMATYVLFCKNATLYYRSGNSDHLSGKKSYFHMQSALSSVTLSCEKILALRNDEISRLACANTYQRWALQFYPKFPQFCDEAESKVKELGGASIGVFGGKPYQILARIFGWKMAKLIKIFLTGRDT